MLNFKVSPKDRPPEKKYPWDKFDVNKMSPKILFSSKDELHEIVADYGKNYYITSMVKAPNIAHLSLLTSIGYTVKPVLRGHSKIEKTMILMTNGSIMKVESIAECSPWSILQYF